MHRKHLDIAFDIKALDESGAFEGYASVFDVVDGFDDRVAPGAFAASLAASRGGRGVKMLWQHDAAEPIGAWDAITEDARGLYVRGRLLLDVRRGAEAHALLKAGAIDGLHLIGVRLATPADRGVGDDDDGDAGSHTLSLSTDFSPLGGVLEKGSAASSASSDEDGAL